MRKGPQTFGAFVVSDFHSRFIEKTQGAAINMGPMLSGVLQISEGVNWIEERSTWLHVHDRFHDFGDLPYTEHLPTKMHFSTAVMDEIKADGSAYLALREQGGRWADSATRQILDKMFRFPFSPYAFMGVDGAVGEIFLKEALAGGALFKYKDDGLELDISKLDDCVEILVADSLATERRLSEQDKYLELTSTYLATKEVAHPPQRKPLNWKNLMPRS